MLRRKKTKAATLLAGTAVIALAVAIPTPAIGLHAGCSLAERLAYPFLHASFLHAALNVWVLFSIVFLYDVSPRLLLTAYLIAISYPVNCLPAEQAQLTTVGLSGIDYALMALIIPQVRRPLSYILTVLAFILTGFILTAITQHPTPITQHPSPITQHLSATTPAAINNLLHLYCFLLPLPCTLRHRRNKSQQPPAP